MDLAPDTLPALTFGPNSVRRFTREELEAVVDQVRLRRHGPRWNFDTERFSEFAWLVVDEPPQAARGPVGARASHLLDETMSGRWDDVL